MNQILDQSGVMLDAILKSKEIYQRAFDVSKAALAVVAHDRRFMRANPEFCRLTGYTEADLIGLPLDEILPPAWIEGARGLFFDATYLCKNGVSRNGRFSFHAIDGDSETFGWIIALDETPLPGPSASAMSQHEKFLHSLIESNDDGILFLDASGRILHMNEAARKQMGSADFNDILNTDYANFWKGQELTAALTAIEAASNGMTGRFQAVMPASNPPRWWDVTITPIALDGGGIHRLMAISRDITPRVRAEQSLEAAKKQLAKTIRECGKVSLRNERIAAELQKARAENQRLSAAVRENEMRARETHHRAKNSLQTIASMIHLQSMRSPDDTAASILDNVRGRIGAMAKVHDMFCRLEKSSLINFREYISELVREISTSLGKKELIRITADIEEAYLGINEAVPCGLLVNEIATNAVKHAFPDGRPGEITVRYREKDGCNTLTIQDNGTGIPDEIDINRPDTLGMELIRELVIQIKGTVTVRRAGGTAYTIQFPKATVR
ncbi:MAG: PAS domain S-box protein [Spirochaetes bacterium]|nr:PAS domain S-box protein [Spirochaetota bacterium]